MKYFDVHFKLKYNFYKTIFISICCLIFTLKIVTLLNEFNGMVSIFSIIKISLIEIPYTVNQTSMVISYFSSFLYMKRMINTEELVTLKASGLSDFKILKPAITFQFCVFILMTFNSFFFISISKKYSKININKLQQIDILSKIKQNSFFSTNNSDNLVIYFDEIDKNKIIKNLILINSSDPNNSLVIVSDDSTIKKNQNEYIFNFKNPNIFSINQDFKLDYSLIEKNSNVNISSIFKDLINENNEKIKKSFNKNNSSKNIINLYKKIDNNNYKSLYNFYYAILIPIYSFITGISCLIIMVKNSNSRLYFKNKNNKLLNFISFLFYILLINIGLKVKIIVLNFPYILYIMPIVTTFIIVFYDKISINSIILSIKDRQNKKS